MNKNCDINKDVLNYISDFKEILKTMIEKMTTAPLNDSISHNFIVQMIPHHEAAIEMSKNVLKYTDNKELTEIAKGIITEQTKSIKNMKKILDECSGLTNPCQTVKDYTFNTNNIMKTMFSGMKSAYTSNRINCNFMREMIPHHMGAVRMSKNALRFNICHELVPILNAIIKSQEKGICEMKSLLQKLNCEI